MREIKFRAWVEDAAVLTPVKGFESNAEGPKWLTLFHAVERPYDYPPRYGGTKTMKIAASRAVLMQYTGLKDKNGVEIYEGDICQVKPMLGNDHKGDTGQVYYYGGLWWLGKPEFGGYHLNKMVSYSEQTGEGISTYLGNVVEVIGNIYQNPELLKGAS